MDLFEQIKEAGDKGFKWGSNDCVCFAANIVRARTGKDYIKEYRNKYRSKKAAEQIIKEAGSLRALMIQQLGEPAPRNQIRRGDPVLFVFKEFEGVGICTGHTAAFLLDRGIVNIPMRAIHVGWNV